MCHYYTDLLAHHSFVPDKDAKPVPYNRVDWWDHPPGVDVVVGRRLLYDSSYIHLYQLVNYS